MNPEERNRLWSRLGVIYVSVVWGTTFYLVKETIRHVDPVAMIFYRFVLASLLTAAIVKFRGGKLFADFRPGLVLGICMWFVFLTQTYGLAITSASNSGFITGLYVPLVPVCGVLLFRRRPRAEQWLAVGLSVFGLWVLTGGLKSVNRGDLLTVVAAAGAAFHILFSEKYVRGNRDPFVLCFQQFFVVAVLAGLQIAVMGLPLGIEGSRTAWNVLYLGIIATVSTIAIQTLAQRHLDAVVIALIFTVEPVFAALFAWTAGGEPFLARQAFGGVIIVGAMLLSEMRIADLIQRFRR